MRRKKILILEDVNKAAVTLKRIINEADPSENHEIIIANTYQDAIMKVRKHRFDFLFVDLLLLPVDLRNDDGHIVSVNDDSKAELFSTKHWNKYVDEEGGIGFVKAIRNNLHNLSNGYEGSAMKTNKDVPIIVTSYFDTLPGYGRIVRAIGAHSNTLFMPKFYKNPLFQDYSNHQNIATLARTSIKFILNDNITESNFFLEKLRRELFITRVEMLDAIMASDVGDNIEYLKEKYFVLSYKFNLVLAIDPRAYSPLDWDLSDDYDYEFSTYYEDWLELRDTILLNPEVKLEYSIEVTNQKTGNTEKIPLPSISEPRWDVQNEHVNKVRRALRNRVTLTYLAHVAEPLQGLVDYGWTVNSYDLQRDSMERISEHSSILSDGDEFFIKWPKSTLGEVNISNFIAIMNGRASGQTLVKEVRDRIKNDIDHFYKNVNKQPPFAVEHVIVSPKKMKNGRREGYFFNGDLKLELLDRNIMNPLSDKIPLNPEFNLLNVYWWSMSSGQNFKCMDGNFVEADELGDRLNNSFNRLTEIKDLNEIPDNIIPQEDVLVCAPMNTDALTWWYVEAQKKNGLIQKLLNKEFKIILVPDTEAAHSARKEVFNGLAELGIHCVYTKPFKDAIPEVKIVDAILCSGPRVKYKGIQSDSLNSHAKWEQNSRNSIAKVKNAYKLLIDSGALGDFFSGSSSIRLGEKDFIITSSRTDKKKVRSEDLAQVNSYSASYNEVNWTGNRKPSSSTPWHAEIFAHRKDVRAILHTHNKIVTYCPALNYLRTEEYPGYGLSMLGKQIDRILSKPEANIIPEVKVAILEGHGEVAVGPSLELCAKGLMELHKLALADQL